MTGIVTRMRAVAESPRVRLGALAVALPLFGGALVLAWQRADLMLGELAAGPILLVVAVVPATVFTSTWQLKASILASGSQIPWWDALRVTTVGSLSGLFPISSTTVVRGGAAVYWGVTPGGAAGVLAFDAVVWLSTSLLYSGAAGLLLGAAIPGAAMVGAGVLLVPAGGLLARSLNDARGCRQIVAARILGMAIQVVRLCASFLALGYGIGLLEVSTLAAASPLASVFFFLPSGMGVREGFTSLMAIIFGFSASMAFLAATLNRLVGFSVLLVWEGVLLALARSGSDGGGG